MFKNPFKKQKSEKDSHLIEETVIGSKSVRHVKEESYEIRVRANSSADVIAQKKRELKVYADAIGYPEARVYVRTEGDWLVIWFKGVYMMSGTDYNPLVYKNIVWVEDLMEVK